MTPTGRAQPAPCPSRLLSVVVVQHSSQRQKMDTNAGQRPALEPRACVSRTGRRDWQAHPNLAFLHSQKSGNAKSQLGIMAPAPSCTRRCHVCFLAPAAKGSSRSKMIDSSRVSPLEFCFFSTYTVKVNRISAFPGRSPTRPLPHGKSFTYCVFSVLKWRRCFCTL